MRSPPRQRVATVRPSASKIGRGTFALLASVLAGATGTQESPPSEPTGHSANGAPRGSRNLFHFGIGASVKPRGNCSPLRCTDFAERPAGSLGRVSNVRLSNRLPPKETCNDSAHQFDARFEASHSCRSVRHEFLRYREQFASSFASSSTACFLQAWKILEPIAACLVHSHAVSRSTLHAETMRCAPFVTTKCVHTMPAPKSRSGLSAKSVHRRRVRFLGASLKRRYRPKRFLERRGAPFAETA